MSISNYKIKNCIDRIDILKDAVINNYLDERNLNPGEKLFSNFDPFSIFVAVFLCFFFIFNRFRFPVFLDLAISTINSATLKLS